MMRYLTFFLMMAVSTAFAGMIVPMPNLVDPRDKQVYKTVQIGYST